MIRLCSREYWPEPGGVTEMGSREAAKGGSVKKGNWVRIPVRWSRLICEIRGSRNPEIKTTDFRDGHGGYNQKKQPRSCGDR